MFFNRSLNVALGGHLARRFFHTNPQKSAALFSLPKSIVTPKCDKTPATME